MTNPPRDLIEDVSIHAPLARGDRFRQGHFRPCLVSIHAPLARGDARFRFFSPVPPSFNPRPSCEGRLCDDPLRDVGKKFQSTPLLRGATPTASCAALKQPVSIHAPLARGDYNRMKAILITYVSIHAPLARGDRKIRAGIRVMTCFNPRPSCEGRLFYRLPLWLLTLVSIHAPLARGDFDRGRRIEAWRSFNPRPSCEGRLFSSVCRNVQCRFQSTPLLRGATLEYFEREQLPGVSIHAPLARGDTPSMTTQRTTGCFNPRPSCEGRHA